MVDVRSGYLVVEGCYHCGARTSFFSDEVGVPVDEYREGPHFWEYLSSAQAVSFNLRCTVCGRTVDLSDMVALKLSTCDDPDCAVGRLNRERGHRGSVYVALCCDSRHEGDRCVSDEGVAALTEYFNQRLRPGRKKFVVVPCKMCNDIDLCRGIVIADTGLTEF
jgi:hypothetical protein